MNFIHKTKIFFKEIWVEAKKIDWPRRMEIVNYTLIVIGISLGVAICLGIFDLIFLGLFNKFVL